jgi:hypothetical protein
MEEAAAVIFAGTVVMIDIFFFLFFLFWTLDTFTRHFSWVLFYKQNSGGSLGIFFSFVLSFMDWRGPSMLLH